jgi:hypothetical protein
MAQFGIVSLDRIGLALVAHRRVLTGGVQQVSWLLISSDQYLPSLSNGCIFRPAQVISAG